MKSTAICAMAALLLTSCAPSGGGEKVHDFCALTGYFRVSDADRISEPLARELLHHNRLRKRICK